MPIRIIEAAFSGDDLRIMPDPTHSHVEERKIAVAQVESRNVFIIFTMREDLIRPVSARYMHKEEVEYYEQENT